jgi:hypothetical protein
MVDRDCISAEQVGFLPSTCYPWRNIRRYILCVLSLYLGDLSEEAIDGSHKHTHSSLPPLTMSTRRQISRPEPRRLNNTAHG